ncbi:MAG: YdeI/OmpD-associated family protein, partial [Caldilineaceae bacterium]|nr:YdeI/OmpD-associated family protein [Caldilineaceae bacterium]
QLMDPENLLEKPGANSRFARYLRFTDAQAISAQKNVILGYVQEAIALERAGTRVDVRDDTPLDYSDELLQFFATDPAFEQAFSALTPGRQRGYLLHFSAAKQSKTKIARIEKCMPKIFMGKGWSER